MNTQAGFVCATIVAVVILGSSAPTTLTAQATDPSTLPLLSSGRLEYVGGFRVPAETVNGLSFLRRSGRRLRPGDQFAVRRQPGPVAEVSIPTPVNSSDVKALPFAKFLQPLTDPTEGRLKELRGRREAG